MAEVPEHLLKRSRERRKALGLPVDGEEGDAPEAEAPDAGGEAAAPAEEAAPGRGERGCRRGRSPRAWAAFPRRCSSGHASARPRSPVAAAAPRRPVVAAPRPRRCRVRRPSTAPAPSGTGPGGHTQRLLTVVKSGSIQQTRADAQDKVHVWPHLLVIEFASILSVTAFLTIFSALVKAPLLGLADVNQTPNPSKAPWYFLGLQELLTMFTPMVAGVTIPGIALGLLMIAPYVDKNPSHKPSDRKFAICIFTIFLMFWSILVIIGSFFRGQGFNFTFPWNDHVFFEL